MIQVAKEFLRRLQSCLSRGDKLLLGVDLMKCSSIILPAYNDSQGLTKAFNLHLLTRINRELGGDFITGRFAFEPCYDSGMHVYSFYKLNLCITISTDF